jgi:hypothetical protein
MKSNLSSLIAAVKAAQRAEAAGNLKFRNTLAEELFSSPRRRSVFLGGHGKIETYWDMQSRNYVTRQIDSGGYPIGVSEFSGDALGAAVQHFWALSKALPQLEAAAEAEFVTKAFGGRTAIFVDRAGKPV